MAALIFVAASIPVTVALWAAILSQQAISPGTEWSYIIATSSLYAAAFGAIQTYESRRISQKIQDTDETKDKKRMEAVARYEIPHIVQSLRMLVLGMGRTALILDRHLVNGKIKTKEGVEHIHRRAAMHIEAIHSLGRALFDVELSEHHEPLDGVLLNLDEIVFAAQDEAVDVEKFKESTSRVVRVMRLISEKHSIVPGERGTP